MKTWAARLAASATAIGALHVASLLIVMETSFALTQITLLLFFICCISNLQLLALAQQYRFRDLQNQSLKSLKKMLHLVEYSSTLRLEDCHHHIELLAVSSIFTNGISVYFYSIGEEMSLLPTVKPWTCNVFEVGHAILYW